jgi:hypothetical protein
MSVRVFTELVKEKVLKFKICFLILPCCIQYTKNQISNSMKQRTQRIILYALLLISFCNQTVQAQIGLSSANSRFEIGLDFGPMSFLGDLGGNRGRGGYGPKDNNIPVTNAIIGISASYYPAEWIGFRVAGNYGKMEGDDRLVKQKQPADTWEGSRKYRNLTFRSPLYEAYAALEIYPTAFISLKNGSGLPRFRPYGIVGFGVFKFNPQGLYKDPAGNESWINLKPLRLEGQGMAETSIPEYSLVNYAIPMGVGLKYDITERVTFAVELIHRKTGSDYIDDVSNKFIDPALFDQYLTPSQATYAKYLANPSSFYPNSNPAYTPYRAGKKRGNPLKNDSYFSSTFRLTWKIGDVYADWFRNKNSMKCPQYF